MPSVPGLPDRPEVPFKEEPLPDRKLPRLPVLGAARPPRARAPSLHQASLDARLRVRPAACFKKEGRPRDDVQPVSRQVPRSQEALPLQVPDGAIAVRLL